MHTRQVKTGFGIPRVTPFVTWFVLACAITLFSPFKVGAATYRVGPGEKYAKVSEVVDGLKAGDVVEITGDISDNFTLTAYGTADKPITIRGVTRVENGRIVRPQITPASASVPYIIKCEGGWIVIEGLGLTGFERKEFRTGAIVHACQNLVLRNCYIHHNIRALGPDGNAAGDILIEFCEFESNGYAGYGPTSLVSERPSATATVQHSYFHDNTGATLLRAYFKKNVIRYNWFENPYNFALQVTTSTFEDDAAGREAAERYYPAHSDIVGNVFDFGWAPTPNGLLQLGGSSQQAPGTEGDFHIAHNLFITRRSSTMPEVPIVVHGNVDRIVAYSNVFLELKNAGCKVYDYEMQWEGPRTRAFRERRGSDKPLVEGSHNWISQTASGVPGGFDNSVIGENPVFVDLVNRNFRPTKKSPLAQKGLWPLPKGRIVKLLPEFEPQRGIPLDLKPRRRRKALPPSIGPFEAAEGEPDFQDDSGQLVLSVRDTEETMQWQLGYGAARRMALKYLSKGQSAEALSSAKMQFLLSPMDDRALDAAIESVKEMLVAVDGNDTRAKLFDRYAHLGAAGEDGKTGTADDLDDPTADVGLDIFRRTTRFYEAFDRRIDARAAMGTGIPYFFKRWQQGCFRADKAFARIEGAEFGAAMEMVVPVLIETIEKLAVDAHRASVLRRNRDLLQRIEMVLSAVARSRTGSIAGAREFVTLHRDYATWGTAGPDGMMSTEDDVHLYENFAAKGDALEDSAAFALLATLQSSHPDSPVVLRLGRRLEALNDAGARVVDKLEFVAYELESGDRSGFMFLCPTPGELLKHYRSSDLSEPVGLEGLDPETREAASSAVRGSLEACDMAAIGAYKALVGRGAPVEVLANARAYLTAYVTSVHGVGGLSAVIELLSEGLCENNVPDFLIEDCLTILDVPFHAAVVFDAIAAWAGPQWETVGKNKWLSQLEAKQRDKVIRMLQEPAKSESSSAVIRNEWIVGACNDFLRRFPGSSRTSDVRFCRLLSQYQAKQYKIVLESADAFLRDHGSSPHVARTMFLQGASLISTGESELGALKLGELVKKYPDANVAPDALHAAAQAWIRLQQYDKASEALQAIVDFYPEDSRARKARQLLYKFAAMKRKGE